MAFLLILYVINMKCKTDREIIPVGGSFVCVPVRQISDMIIIFLSMIMIICNYSYLYLGT